MTPFSKSESLRVLVIDDDDISRETIVTLLREAGHRATSLPSPIGATKHIVDADVQVVVIDVMMPSMRGDKLAALLSKNPKLKALGVVLVTPPMNSRRSPPRSRPRRSWANQRWRRSFSRRYGEQCVRAEPLSGQRCR